MGFSTSSTDPEIQSLTDQLNGQSRQFGIVNGKFPRGAPAGSLATYQTPTTLNFHLADGAGQFGDPIALPKALQYYTGLTQSAGAPSTTELPASGNFGWHLNTSTGAYYFAYNSAGTVVFPNFASIAGTISATQHGVLVGDGLIKHDFGQISGTITAAQHGTLSTGTLHPFTVISGSITAAQHGTQTDSTLHAAATASTAGFMSAAQAATLADVTTTGTPTHLLNGTEIQVNGTKVVGAQLTGWSMSGGLAQDKSLTAFTPGVSYTASDLTQIMKYVDAIFAALITHGLVGA